MRVWTIALAFTLIAIAQPPQRDATATPETVVITLHSKKGSESALARVVARHWTTARRLNLVLDSPHITVRATEEGDRTSIIDIFTWRDGSIPDSPPPPIREIWREMSDLVESRGGRAGIEIATGSLVTSAAGVE